MIVSREPNWRLSTIRLYFNSRCGSIESNHGEKHGGVKHGAVTPAGTPNRATREKGALKWCAISLCFELIVYGGGN